jgi:predicted nucleic acid-binding protein
MSAHWDTSALLKLYLAEPDSPAVRSVYSELALPVWLTALHQLEARNALELLAARGQLSESAQSR